MKNLITYIKELIMADNAIRPKNYTDEMVASMTAKYVANPTRDTVESLARSAGAAGRTSVQREECPPTWNGCAASTCCWCLLSCRQ